MKKLVSAIENLQVGLYWMMEGNVMNRIKLAPYALYRWYMNIAKHIEPEFVLWLWFMLVGLFQLYFTASSPDSPSGLDYLTRDDNLQMLIAVGFVLYGGMTAYWKKDWMIALGTIIVMGFSLIITKGLIEGGVGIRGISGIVYLILMVMSLIGFTSTRETNREQRVAIRKLEQKVADLTAGVAAKVSAKDGTTDSKPI